LDELKTRMLPKLHMRVVATLTLATPSPAPIFPKIRLSTWHSQPGRSP
jgi:hypothetical protein